MRLAPPPAPPKLALALLVLAISLVSGGSRPHQVCPECLLLHGPDGSTSNGSVAFVANASDPDAAGIRVPTKSLLAALSDPKVTTVMLLTNYSVDEFDARAGESPALRLQRNVTLTAPPGLMPLLDFKFMRSAVHLCATCVFHIHYVAIANERRGNGASVDFFVGEPGSVVKLEDSYRLRLACTSTESTLELINREQPRSPSFPLEGATNATQRQILGKQNVTFLEHDYVDMVWLVDYSYDVPSSFQEGEGIVGGFNMRTINTTRLCYTTISTTCLKVKGPDACVNEAIDSLLSPQSRAAGDGPQQQQAQQQQQQAPAHNSTWLIAVVVPVVVVAGLMATAGLVFWVMCARQRQQRKGQAGAAGKSHHSLSDMPGGGSNKSLGGGVGGNSASSSSRQRALLEGEEGSSDPFFVDDLGEPRLDQGWEVVAVGTSPSLGAVGNPKIHFGRLLGAGSFGRVYQGRWAGREVAIKCIEHDSETSKAVENEVQLMLAMDHPNIVKALHYVTYRHTLNVLSSSGGSANGNGSCERGGGGGAATRPGGSGGGAGAAAAAVAAAAAGAAGAGQQAGGEPGGSAGQAGCDGGMSSASRGRQQREQQKQLHQLERQLQSELGLKHQWLLDMHLGFLRSPLGGGGGGSGRNSVVSSSSTGAPATVVSSSPGMTSAALLLSSEQLSRQSTTCAEQLSPCRASVVDAGVSRTCSSNIAAVQQSPWTQVQLHNSAGADPSVVGYLPADGVPVPPGQASSPPAAAAALVPQVPVNADTQQQQQQQQWAVHSAGDLPHVVALPPGLLEQQPPVQISLPALDPHLADPNGLPVQQQQQPHISIDVPDRQLDHPDGTCWSSGGSGSLHSSTARSANGDGAGGSYPSTGQALTPNQKAQLQRYLMRQQHLLQTSGMRVRSSAVLPLPSLNGQQQQQSDAGSVSDTGGGSGSDGPEGSRAAARRAQDAQRSRTYIVQEYCDLGTFTSYASKTLTDSSEDEQMMQLLVLLQDAARGIAALHAKSVVHGDVNARNVLVSSSSSAPYGAVARLADLGLSRVIRQQATHKTTNTVGTLSHMPPELLRHGRMSPAVDIYSYGVMMWEVFTAQPAFRHLHYGQFFECIVLKNMRPNVPEDMPRDYSLLMLSCWATNPADRPSADRLLELLQMMLQERQEARDELLLGPQQQQPYLQPPFAAAAAGGGGGAAAGYGTEMRGLQLGAAGVVGCTPLGEGVDGGAGGGWGLGAPVWDGELDCGSSSSSDGSSLHLLEQPAAGHAVGQSA